MSPVNDCWCRACLPDPSTATAVRPPPPPPPEAASAPATVLVSAHELLTTEPDDHVARPESLLDYVTSLRQRKAVAPVPLLPSRVVLDLLPLELTDRRVQLLSWARRTLQLSRLPEILAQAERASEAAAFRLAQAPYCLLDGNHRALAAALLDVRIEGVVLRSPEDVVEYRGRDPEFPHRASKPSDLGLIWLEFVLGPANRVTFESPQIHTAAERAALLAKSDRLPDRLAGLARQLLARAAPPTVEPCSCPPKPGEPGGAASWRDYGEAIARCPTLASRPKHNPVDAWEWAAPPPGGTGADLVPGVHRHVGGA